MITPREIQKFFKGIDIFSMSENDLEEYLGIIKVECVKVETLVQTRIYARDHVPKIKSED